MLNNICIIPARKNSKRIKNKNIKNFLGKPIISYAIKTAIKSKIFDKVIVSTDSVKIKKIAEKFGAIVPYLRNKNISDDHTPTREVLVDVVNQLNLDDKKNLFCLYPTAVLIDENDIKKAYKKFKALKSDSLFAITNFDHSPFRSLKIKGYNVIPKNLSLFKKRTQDLQELYRDSGTFSIYKTSFLRRKKNLFSKNTSYFKLSKLKAIDIDTIEDFKLAEHIKKFN